MPRRHPSTDRASAVFGAGGVSTADMLLNEGYGARLRPDPVCRTAHRV